MNLLLGRDSRSGQSVRIPSTTFGTHWHLIGGTGKGKTTAIEAMIHQLLMSMSVASFFIFDRMGSFSQSLLLWFASPYCPSWIRDRVVYIDASREDIVPTFNPLLFDTPAHGYFKTQRAGDVILRAWASQNIEEMPRLARWVFNAMWAVAQLGLTVADCAHLLMPGSMLHDPLLARLPEQLRAEWNEIVQARGGEAGRILESSRNRLKPFFENPILRSIFGSTENRLDVLRFMREGKIVILNLSPQNRLSSQLADAIGGMVLNELLATARSLPRGVRYPTYVLLDEFQRFVGPDIEEAIPEVRQLDVRLLFSHQSLSQLKRGDTDLTSLIFQAQSRLIMGVQGEDADILGHELASITYDPERIKDEVYTRRQLLSEQRIIQLATWSQSEAEATNWQKTVGKNWSEQFSNSTSNGSSAGDSSSNSTARRFGVPHDLRTSGNSHTEGRTTNSSAGRSSGHGENESTGEGGSKSQTFGMSIGQSILPVYETFRELSRRSYYTFEEQAALWAKEIRLLKTGQALLRMVNDPALYRVDVRRHAPGYLSWDLPKIMRCQSSAIDRVSAMIEENYRSEVFTSPCVIERETTERLQRVLHPRIEVLGVSQERAGQIETNGNPLL